MFKRFTHWYRTWEQELLDVMRDPALAEKVPPGYRRRWAMHFARMSELDRRYLADLTVDMMGKNVGRNALVLCVVLALVGGAVHFAQPKVSLGVAIVVTEVLGLALVAMGLSMWFYYRIIMAHKFKYIAAFLFMSTSGAMTGLASGAIERGEPVLAALIQHGPGTAKVVLGGSAVILLLGLGVSAWRNAGFEKLALSLQAEAERERLARQLTETQLRLLHAQIEPHFLFNTLGAVQELAEREHARAAASLTANLIAFLRSTASGMAQESATLHDEFELARAYLGVMGARLGQRLQVTFSLPPELTAHRLPGMSVLTLAENAVKHGVEPSPHPIHITVAAERDGDQVRVQVRDTGAGLAATTAGGMGLQNLRDRLRLAFGAQAGLALYEQESGGVVAEITMPLQVVEGVAA